MRDESRRNRDDASRRRGRERARDDRRGGASGHKRHRPYRRAHQGAPLCATGARGGPASALSSDPNWIGTSPGGKYKRHFRPRPTSRTQQATKSDVPTIVVSSRRTYPRFASTRVPSLDAKHGRRVCRRTLGDRRQAPRHGARGRHSRAVPGPELLAQPFEPIYPRARRFPLPRHPHLRASLLPDLLARAPGPRPTRREPRRDFGAMLERPRGHRLVHGDQHLAEQRVPPPPQPELQPDHPRIHPRRVRVVRHLRREQGPHGNGDPRSGPRRRRRHGHRGGIRLQRRRVSAERDCRPPLLRRRHRQQRADDDLQRTHHGRREARRAQTHLLHESGGVGDPRARGVDDGMEQDDPAARRARAVGLRGRVGNLRDGHHAAAAGAPRVFQRGGVQLGAQ